MGDEPASRFWQTPSSERAWGKGGTGLEGGTDQTGRALSPTLSLTSWKGQGISIHSACTGTGLTLPITTGQGLACLETGRSKRKIGKNKMGGAAVKGGVVVSAVFLLLLPQDTNSGTCLFLQNCHHVVHIFCLLHFSFHAALSIPLMALVGVSTVILRILPTFPWLWICKVNLFSVAGRVKCAAT